MKRKRFLAMMLAFGVTVTGFPVTGALVHVQAQTKDSSVFKGEEWFDQNDVFQVNREDAHTSFVGFDNADSVKNPALRKKHDTSPFY